MFQCDQTNKALHFPILRSPTWAKAWCLHLNPSSSDFLCLPTSYAKARTVVRGHVTNWYVEIVSFAVTLFPQHNEQPNRRRVKLYHPLRDWTDHSRRQRIWEIAKRNRRESSLGSAAHWRDHLHGRIRTSCCGSSASSKWVLRVLSSQLHIGESPILGDGSSPMLMYNTTLACLLWGRFSVHSTGYLRKEKKLKKGGLLSHLWWSCLQVDFDTIMYIWMHSLC